MNILKKAIIGLILSVNSVALAEEVRNNYNYWGIGAGIPTIVSAKFGHREQIGHNGFEYGIGVTPLVYITEAHVFGSYLYYPNPNLEKQTYFGVGLRAGGFLEINRAKFAYVAPGLIFGRETLDFEGKRRFVQVALGASGLSTQGFLFLSSVSLTFGYSF